MGRKNLFTKSDNSSHKKSKKEGGERKMKKIGLIVMAIAISLCWAVPKAEAIIIPQGPIALHMTDASGNFRWNDTEQEWSPVGIGAPLVIGDEDRSVGNIESVWHADGPPGWSTSGLSPVWTPSLTDEFGFMMYDIVLAAQTWTPEIDGSVTQVFYYEAGNRYTTQGYTGRADLWQDTSADWNTLAGNAPQAGPGAWVEGISHDSYPGIDDAPNNLWLTSRFVPYLDLDHDGTPEIVYKCSINVYPATPNIVNTGYGDGYLEILGGSGQGAFVPGQFTIGPLNAIADIWLHHDLSTGSNGWQVTSSDPIRAYGTPEPCTLILLGFGLFGFAFMGKRRKSKKI
ncbi:MAG: PEP-CTERM sorting domain-containing protein [Candidatus Omnitrophica bacterium]|nr:PEP-CTERM sorting domain-containing protein [Candidatus Omnitrophota bacterium]